MLGSIKGRLFLLFFIFSSLALLTIGFFMHYEIKKVVLDSVDHTLHSKIQMVTGLIHEEHGTIELELSEVISGEYSIPRSGHYYKVIMDGKVLAASPSLVDENYDLTSGNLEYEDREAKERIFTSTGPDEEPIRVLQHDLNLLGRSFSIFVAESLAESLTMIENFKRFLLFVIPAGILSVTLWGLWITRQSLRPLENFSSRIKIITHKNMNKRIDAEKEVRELRTLARSFDEMLDRLQQAFEAQKRLISDASHELKTPVSVIKTHCDVMLQKERTADELLEVLKKIKAVSDNMGRLIKDLLTLARLDSGILAPGDFKRFSINECVHQAIELTTPMALRKSIIIKDLLSNDIHIIGDKDKITEAILNILENAINYNKENGTVEITSSVDNNWAKISIKDTGIGIKKEELERIFERFFRSDGVRSKEGTGLGLSIAKAIIEAHRGTIQVESEYGKGSCFILMLPLSSL